MSLEIRTEHGEPTEVKIDGQVVENIKLVSFEAEPGITIVHIEMTPSFVASLEEGQIHWMVCCPNCEHNSVHTCELDPGLEPEDREVIEGLEDRTVGGSVSVIPVPMPLVDVDREGNVVISSD